MNPDKRFGQIEEILAEMLAKQDEHTAQIGQLARTVGQVLEVSLEAKDIATKSIEIALESKGIAIESRDIAIESRDIALRADRKADIIADAVANLTVDVQRGFVQVNGRFDELMDFLKQKLG